MSLIYMAKTKTNTETKAVVKDNKTKEVKEEVKSKEKEETKKNKKLKIIIYQIKMNTNLVGYLNYK